MAIKVLVLECRGCGSRDIGSISAGEPEISGFIVYCIPCGSVKIDWVEEN